MGILTPSPLYFEQVLGGQDDNDDGAIKLCPKCVGFSYLQKIRDKIKFEAHIHNLEYYTQYI